LSPYPPTFEEGAPVDGRAYLRVLRERDEARAALAERDAAIARTQEWKRKPKVWARLGPRLVGELDDILDGTP
jgi:hypothetical protein